MRKILAGIGVVLMGAGMLAGPASAQQLPAASSVETVTQVDAGSSVADITEQATAAVRSAVPADLIPGFAYDLFPVLAQPSAPAPAPAATTVLRNCGGDWAAAEVRPEFILLYCGDGHSFLGDITWHNWSLEGASGRARLGERVCGPSCATGWVEYRYVDFTLGGVEWHGDEPRFTRAYLEGRECRIGQPDRVCREVSGLFGCGS